MSKSVLLLTLEVLNWNILGKFIADSRLHDELRRAPNRTAHLKLSESNVFNKNTSHDNIVTTMQACCYTQQNSNAQ